MVNNISKKMPPKIWGLFLFLFICLLHLALLITIYYNIKFIVLLIIEFIFFIYYSKISLKILFKIFIISGFIFLLNVIFNEGKIITEFGVLKITSDGIISGLKKSGLIAGTLFFTYNILKKNKFVLIDYIDRYNKNIIINSINYFFIFFEVISEKINFKRFIVKIILIYNNKYKRLNTKCSKNIISFDFYIYNFIFILFYSIIAIYSYIVV